MGLYHVFVDEQFYCSVYAASALYAISEVTDMLIEDHGWASIIQAYED